MDPAFCADMNKNQSPGCIIWHVSFRSGEASRELLYSVYFTLLYFTCQAYISGLSSLLFTSGTAFLRTIASQDLRNYILLIDWSVLSPCVT